MKRGVIWGLGALALIALLAAGAWWWWTARGAGTAPAVANVSPETAAAAQLKLEALQAGTDSAVLSDVELTSLIRYRSPAWVRNTLVEPSVELGGDTLRVSGILPTDRLPEHPALRQLRLLLPDSARVDVLTTGLRLPDGRAALRVHDVQLAGIPVPARYYPDVLQRVRGPDDADLPQDAIALPLPPGARTARLAGGVLILTP